MPNPTQALDPLAAFWQAFVRSAGGVGAGRAYEAFAFGDSPELASELAELVLRGTKRATASAAWNIGETATGATSPENAAVPGAPSTSACPSFASASSWSTDHPPCPIPP